MQHVFKTQNYHGHRSSYIDYGTVVLTEETVHSHPHHHLSIYLVTKMMLWNWPIWKQPIVDVEIYVKLLALLLSSGFSSMILFYKVLLEDKAHKLSKFKSTYSPEMQPKELSLRACPYKEMGNRRRRASPKLTDMDKKAQQ